jgi:iron complex transport system substrate-binding protein
MVARLGYMRRNTLTLVTLLMVVAAPLTGAATAGAASAQADSCSFPYAATDATGTEVTLDSDPERVVTLSPSAAQTMWELGASEEVVGVSQYAAYLDGAAEKANVSGGGGPSVERVLAANPDLVLVPNTTYGFARDRVEQIRAQGVPVFVFGAGTSLSFVADKTERIGRLTGNCEAGRESAAEIRTSVEQMREVLADEEKPVGLDYFYGYTSGANTFIGDVMTTGGLRNGAAEAGVTGFAQVNTETVVEMNPEYVVVPSGASVPNTAAWNSTTAVQEGNVVVVNEDYLQQPAPRSVDAAETIMRAVHPEAFEEYRAMQTQSNATATAAETETATTGDPPETTARPTTTAAVDDTPAASQTATGTSTPGFGVLLALVSLLATALLAARR